MEEHDRATIDRYCEQFLPNINMTTLWPKLLEHKIFNWNDANIPLWKVDLDDPETKRDILLTIKTRGPCAFKNLVLSLRQTNHRLLADILEGRAKFPSVKDVFDDDNASRNSDKSEQRSVDDDFHDKLRSSTKPLLIKVRKSTTFHDGPNYETLGTYRMRSRPRGYVLIITIIRSTEGKPRRAAEHDEVNLTKLFKDMGFDVTSKTNLTGAEIKKVVKDFSRRDFYATDSCFVIVSAHGGNTMRNGFSETEIKGCDFGSPGAEKVHCTDIIDCFAARNCQLLIGKPKVFIYQACSMLFDRGEREQTIAKIETDGIKNNAPARDYSDMLVAYSTLPGHVAYRDTMSGSWYIQVLCEVFMNHAHKTHLQDLFNMVDHRLMKVSAYDSKSQTSMVQSIGFNKHCYLNPGLFED